MMTPNKGFDAGIAQRSPAARLGFTLKGAPRRQKDKIMRPNEAVFEARKLSIDLAGKLQKKGLAAKDCVVSLVFAQRNNLGKLAEPVELFRYPVPNMDSLDLMAVHRHTRHIPVGVIVMVLDREAKELIGDARPWIVSDAGAVKLVESLRDKVMQVDAAGELKDWRVS
jgi:hypothetical protein